MPATPTSCLRCATPCGQPVGWLSPFGRLIILVAGEKKAQRVMESVTRFIERKLKLVVNRTKSKSGPLIESSFLGFCISSRGSIKWTAKAHARFKQRVKEITRRNRGHAVQTVIDELRRYAVGWMNYFGISRTYREVLELDDWIRRRVRLYHWTALPRQRHL
jgi:RNA-directed DNA polymerase